MLLNLLYKPCDKKENKLSSVLTNTNCKVDALLIILSQQIVLWNIKLGLQREDQISELEYNTQGYREGADADSFG